MENSNLPSEKLGAGVAVNAVILPLASYVILKTVTLFPIMDERTSSVYVLGMEELLGLLALLSLVTLILKPPSHYYKKSLPFGS